ncbi:uncharacterized protein TRAVEDRAFT_42244 [Trametes versicolor FP-101664 SS1]|uniref:uncharacterized protein n=1 Tax=Trametes versicolor (strain FP-101664) TaxID=717944 RepID=UPI000462203F|nr:uncharacterized protein TRAVEDRAFT_42244 [Trametes versicolor FP-101664 SS1]EIW64831.1 hypothetical protein TRAVEDRAFT_42244 [Trametes versicolor FP-101664 SS1]
MVTESIREKELFAAHAHRLSWASSSYDPIIDAIGDAQVVLIGDGSHGTYEFYAHRANLTKRLIGEKGFTAVAVEADWPDALRINSYIHGGALGDSKIKNARDALAEFERFPKWMWKNETMPTFVEYLKQHNERVLEATQDPSRTVSFHGMDLYSLHRSAQQVLAYLDKVDPEGATAARKRYNCFERFGEDTMRYAYETQFGLKRDCHREVIDNLVHLLRSRQKILEQQLGKNPHGHPFEEQFIAEMNALVVKDAEEYYRTMMTEDVISWNLRDDHFARVVAGISQFFASSDGGLGPAKIVVWAHNSHVGDARATDMGRRRGEINIGQRCREIFGDHNVFNIGFLTNRGTVTASHNWDEPPYLQRMNPPLQGSIESVFDQWLDSDAFIVTHKIIADEKGRTKKVRVSDDLSEFLDRRRYQRFIGVIYRRLTEAPSHYCKCSVAKQFDCVVHIRESRGIKPLEQEDTWKGPKAEADLTFPFAE